MKWSTLQCSWQDNSTAQCIIHCSAVQCSSWHEVNQFAMVHSCLARLTWPFYLNCSVLGLGATDLQGRAVQYCRSSDNQQGSTVLWIQWSTGQYSTVNYITLQSITVQSSQLVICSAVSAGLQAPQLSSLKKCPWPGLAYSSPCSR